MEFAFANEIPHGGGAHHDFHGSNPAAAFLFEQGLGQHRFQGFRQLCADLRLLVGWNASMMRSIVFGALEVWRVANTRCPVSAAVKAN